MSHKSVTECMGKNSIMPEPIFKRDYVSIWHFMI